ncbi:biotin-independent malonate decarboxylase subunit gamma [Vogesella sp. LIG4]|uniref:biotin-independent malonate decarboxylase subunit gamma n=1 Tax=Vogesella sp. LIG4 TaxID=1192162 RepID=UPI00081FC478|nr:biotin-independent malonate decarboxylase subunit gamma [Vogesella sp. LIG4]SCK24416.1 malonate decarboxylase gamma subunit [Vogesella sp. LIG4]
MQQPTPSTRGRDWFQLLTAGQPPLAQFPSSLLVADAELAGRPARYLALVADAANPFPRARNGEAGLLEGWALAQAVNELVAADRTRPDKRAIVAIIDVPSQAYGRREEAYGIHQALAAAAAAYAGARLAGHPVIGLIVGKAMSGGFLAHGYQASRLLALDDAGVMVHAMSKQSAARVTQRSEQELATLAARIPPMAYDIASFANLGLLWRLLPVASADAPSTADLGHVRAALAAALDDIARDPAPDLASRLGPARSASLRVRARLREQWHD